jgi:hypothetical protein
MKRTICTQLIYLKCTKTKRQERKERDTEKREGREKQNNIQKEEQRNK